MTALALTIQIQTLNRVDNCLILLIHFPNDEKQKSIVVVHLDYSCYFDIYIYI